MATHKKGLVAELERKWVMPDFFGVPEYFAAAEQEGERRRK